MKFPREQHRQFERTFLVWYGEQEKSGGEFHLEASHKASNGFFEQNPNLKTMKPADLEEAVRKHFQEKYNPAQFEKEMRAFIKQNLSGENNESHINRLVKDSKDRYQREYELAMLEFRSNLDDRVDAYKDLVGSLEDAAETQAEPVGDAIEYAQAAKNSNPTFENAVPKANRELMGGTWSYNIPIVGPIFRKVDLPFITPIIANHDYLAHKDFSDKTKDAFVKKFLPTLDTQYLNLEWQKMRLGKGDLENYENLSEKFSDGMKISVGHQLGYILETSPTVKILQEKLEELRNKIVETYSGIAKDGIIDLEELVTLDRQGSQCADFSKMLTGYANDEALLNGMEAVNYMNLDHWVEASGKVADILADRAYDTGAEAKFVKAVKTRATDEEVTNFNQAKSVFKKMLEERTKAGIRKGMELVQEINKEIFDGQEGFQKLEKAPESIRGMVSRERQLLIEGGTRSNNADDEIVVSFIREARGGRETILRNGTQRDLLFQAVKNIQARDTDPVWSQQVAKVPKKTSDLWTGYDIEKPSAHDILARHLAVVALADEAEWTINNLAGTDAFKGQDIDLKKELSETGAADAALRKPNYNFVNTRKRRSTLYVSGAELAGFNSRDVGFKLIQVWGAITLIMNIKAAYEDGKKLGDIPGKLLKNPIAWASFGAMFGTEAIKRNPESSKIFSATPGEQEKIMQNFAFRNFSKSKHFGATRLQQFMADGDEDVAMTKLMLEDPKGKTVEAALKKAEKRNPRDPALEKEDLAGLLNETQLAHLPVSRDLQWEKARYKFYKKFLPTEVKQLKKNYQDWLAG